LYLVPLEKSYSVDVNTYDDMKRKEENKSIKDKRKVSLIEDIEGLESFVLEKPLPPAVSEVTHSSIEIKYYLTLK
jgi:hypothetical protein